MKNSIQLLEVNETENDDFFFLILIVMKTENS